MAIILFDNSSREKLFPLTLTKAVADLRCGILTIKERWELKAKQKVFIHTSGYLSNLYTSVADLGNTWIDASIMPDELLTERIINLQNGEALADDNGLIAGRTDVSSFKILSSKVLDHFDLVVTLDNVVRLEYPFQIFQWNDKMIRQDFALITADKIAQPISHTNQILHHENIFIEESATVEFCALNSTTGPIYIGKDATMMEGSMVRGPFALGENSLLKMGAKVYGATTIGPNCVAGGEIKNVVMQANSNKAHDGYLGDSVIGEWCNMGAGTSNSNVKNTGGEVKLWNKSAHAFMDVGQKCGVIMGDYSRTAINSSINTGSVIGVSCNVFGEGLLPNIIDDFSWGLAEPYRLDKALNDIQNWKQMKHQHLTEAEIAVLKHIFVNSIENNKL